MKRRKFLFRASGLLLVPAFPAIVHAQFLPKRRGSVGAGSGGGGNDNIAFRNKSAVIGTGTNATPTEPASAAANDIFIAIAACASSTTLAIPAGWTSIYSGSSSTPKFKYNLAWIRRGGSAPSLTWAIGASVYREVHILAYSGVVTSGNPYDASTDGGNSSVQNPDCPSVTTISANAFVLATAVNWSGSTTSWGAPAGYTIRSDNTAGNDLVMAEKKVVATGAENPAAYSGGSTTDDTWTSSVALKSS